MPSIHHYRYAMEAYKEGHIDPHTVACARYFTVARRAVDRHTREEWKLKLHAAMYSLRSKLLEAFDISPFV